MALCMCLLIVLASILAANPTKAKHRQLESLEEVLERMMVEYEAEAEELKEEEEDEEETGGDEEDEDEEDEEEEELKKKQDEKKKKKEEEDKKRKEEEEERNKKKEEEEKRRKEEEEASKPRSLHHDTDSEITKTTTETPLQEATTIQHSTTPRSLGHNIYTKPGSTNKKCYCEEITDTNWPFTLSPGGRSRQEKGGDSGAREAKGNGGSSENSDGKSSDGDRDKESDNPKRDNSGDSERVKRSLPDAIPNFPKKTCGGCGSKSKPNFSLQDGGPY